MRDIAESSEPGRGAIWVCDVGQGGEPVRLVSDSGRGAALVWFVSEMGPGVKAVNVVEGGPPRAAHAGMPGGGQQPAAARVPTEADMAALSQEEDAILSRMSALWQAVQQTGGADTGALEAAANFAVQHLDRQWSSDQWTEMCLMIGGNSAVALWARQRDAEAALLRLRPLSQKILDLQWLQGGPAGTFEGKEARAIMSALGAAEQALKPTAAPEPMPPKKRRLFGGR